MIVIYQILIVTISLFVLIKFSIFVYKEITRIINERKYKIEKLENTINQLEEELKQTQISSDALRTSYIDNISLIKEYIDNNENILKTENIKLDHNLKPREFIIETGNPKAPIGKGEVPQEPFLDVINKLKYKNGKKYSSHYINKARISGETYGKEKNQIQQLNDGIKFKSIFFNYEEEKVFETIFKLDTWFNYTALDSIDTADYPEKINVKYKKGTTEIKEVYAYQHGGFGLEPKYTHKYPGKIPELDFLLRKEELDFSESKNENIKNRNCRDSYCLKKKEYKKYDKEGNLIEIRTFQLEDEENSLKWEQEELKSITNFYYNDNGLLFLKKEYSFVTVSAYIIKDNIVCLKEEYEKEFSKDGETRIDCVRTKYNYNSEDKLLEEEKNLYEIWNFRDLKNDMKSKEYISYKYEHYSYEDSFFKNYIYDKEDFFNTIFKLKSKKLLENADMDILFNIFIKYTLKNKVFIIEYKKREYSISTRHTHSLGNGSEKILNIYIHETETLNS